MYIGTYKPRWFFGRIYLPGKWKDSVAGKTFYFYHEYTDYNEPEEAQPKEEIGEILKSNDYIAIPERKYGCICSAETDKNGAFLITDVPFLAECIYICGAGDEILFICDKNSPYITYEFGWEIECEELESLGL